MTTMDTNPLRNKVKLWLTAIAGTIGAIGAAQLAGAIHLPDQWIKVAKEAAIWIGILGASPLGRIIFKDDPAGDHAQ